MLANRITKNARHLAKWAKREGVSCYRVYDCDIPELPLTVDRYDTDAGLHALVALWPSSSKASPTHDEAWVATMCDSVAEVLSVPRANLHLRVRVQQEGHAQYERLGQAAVRYRVQEDGLTFLVNLDDYLDTGLFLDHRLIRRRVREEARGKRVLNLFAYTGAFSVHAAAGGAAQTTTVDLSQTYLDWAKDNLAANGFDGEIVRADVVQWLDQAHDHKWDIAIVDPPTFSNSKKMRGVFDVQRDHVELLRRVYGLMRPNGVVYFSTNARRFKPDEQAFRGQAREITRETMPLDFRDDKIHRAWRIQL